MIALLKQKQAPLADLCGRYGVARLEVFGSAATGQFDPERSDLDFLVEFKPSTSMRPFHQYFDFLAELKDLFGREVDLVEATAVKNPYFLRSMNASRKLLYAA
jgi:hypothetical protein